MPIDFPVWYMRTVFVFALAASVVGIALRSRVGRWLGLCVVGGYYVAVEELKMLPNVQAYPAFAILLWYVGGMIASASRRDADGTNESRENVCAEETAAGYGVELGEGDAARMRV